MTEHNTQENSETSTDTLSTHSYQSDNLILEVIKRSKCRTTFQIHAKSPLIKDARNDAIKQIAKEVSIPGFRKGKAPASLIEKQYPREIAQGWDKSLADRAFKEAQTLAQIPILHGDSKISYQVKKLDSTEGEILFQFERAPEVPDFDYNSFSLKKIDKKEVTDQDVENTILSIQMFYAKWEQIEDRPVQEGDFVVLDIDDLDQDPPIQAFSNSRFEVREKRMGEWMRKLVVGKKKGDSVDGVSMPDEHETEEVKKEFQPKKVRLHIKHIEQANLPPFDDEFAKKVGSPNITAMKIQLKNLLLKQAHEEWLRAQRESISDELITKVIFEVPASILEQEANFRVSNLFKNPSFAKEWKESMTEEQKQTKKQEIITQAEHALRLFYISQKIVHDNKISLPEEELSPNYNTILEMMFADPARVNLNAQSKEQQAIEFSRFMMAKAQDFIIEKIQKNSR